MKRSINIALAFFGSFAFFSCSDDLPKQSVSHDIVVIPEGFPAIDYPEDNPFNAASWELGKALFYDVRLSRDSSISCGSCHKQEFSFGDDVNFSPGIEERSGLRNAPSLANVAYHPYFTREGGVLSLETQVLVPIQEHNEFDFNILEIADRLTTDVNYQNLSNEAYGRTLDYFVLVRAIATFERSLISGNSAFDKYQYQNKEDALSQTELAGKELFYSSKTNCSGCHSGFNFTDYSFSNNGLYSIYNDSGRVRLTGKAEDNAVFKVPSLRNAEYTAPYMHDGSMKTLSEVIEHYNSGGFDHPNKSELIKPLNLSETEKSQLLAFLMSLSDVEFINDSKFRK